jgi:hypothetical protein
LYTSHILLLQAHATQLSSDELIQRGTLLKTQGNVVFKQVIIPAGRDSLSASIFWQRRAATTVVSLAQIKIRFSIIKGAVEARAPQ